MTVGSVRLHRAHGRARLGEGASPGGRARRVVGGFYLSMGGVHLGIVGADAETYGTFADAALFDFVKTGWSEIFMANPVAWGLVMFLGETTLGVLLLHGGPLARVGWAGVVGFHLALMLFGFGIWLWCVPVLAVLVPLAVRDWPRLSREHQ